MKWYSFAFYKLCTNAKERSSFGVNEVEDLNWACGCCWLIPKCCRRDRVGCLVGTSRFKLSCKTYVKYAQPKAGLKEEQVSIAPPSHTSSPPPDYFHFHLPTTEKRFWSILTVTGSDAQCGHHVWPWYCLVKIKELTFKDLLIYLKSKVTEGEEEMRRGRRERKRKESERNYPLIHPPKSRWRLNWAELGALNPNQDFHRGGRDAIRWPSTTAFSTEQEAGWDSE